METVEFEWDEKKNRENQRKHGVSFETAQFAFVDPNRVISEDTVHSYAEQRYHCTGLAGYGILTVSFTYRHDKIRIINAGYWRQGKKIYEERNKIH
ncbi:MAG: BrnT family toxin [Candidatus Marinimicrobia bacterium]|nr:BrnT family toxin [Candidatus Neomarinimicrobiota bacterium]